MKKIGFIFLIFILLLALVGVCFSPNCRLICSEVKSMFKDTIYWNCKIDVNELSGICVTGLTIFDNYPYTYTNKNEMQSIITFVSQIEFIEAKENELPNKSSDVDILFYDIDGKVVRSLNMYGEVFMKDTYTNKIYRCKDENLIEELEKLLRTI